MAYEHKHFRMAHLAPLSQLLLGLISGENILTIIVQKVRWQKYFQCTYKPFLKTSKGVAVIINLNRVGIKDSDPVHQKNRTQLFRNSFTIFSDKNHEKSSNILTFLFIQFNKCRTKINGYRIYCDFWSRSGFSDRIRIPVCHYLRAKCCAETVTVPATVILDKICIHRTVDAKDTVPRSVPTRSSQIFCISSRQICRTGQMTEYSINVSYMTDTWHMFMTEDSINVSYMTDWNKTSIPRIQ